MNNVIMKILLPPPSRLCFHQFIWWLIWLSPSMIAQKVCEISEFFMHSIAESHAQHILATSGVSVHPSVCHTMVLSRDKRTWDHAVFSNGQTRNMFYTKFCMADHRWRHRETLKSEEVSNLSCNWHSEHV